MVRPLIKVRTFERLRKFWKGEITVYVSHIVASQRIVCCNAMLIVNSKILDPLPYVNRPFCRTQGNAVFL